MFVLVPGQLSVIWAWRGRRFALAGVQSTLFASPWCGRSGHLVWQLVVFAEECHWLCSKCCSGHAQVCAEAGQWAGVVEHQKATALVAVLEGTPACSTMRQEWGSRPTGAAGGCGVCCSGLPFCAFAATCACCALCLDKQHLACNARRERTGLTEREGWACAGGVCLRCASVPRKAQRRGC